MESLINADIYKLIILTLCIISIIVCIAIFLPKTLTAMGVKKISKEGVELTNKQIGDIESKIKEKTSNTIHEVQRKQISFVKKYLKNCGNQINRFIDEKGYRHSDFNIMYAIELMYDEVVTWIIFNNIENDTEYISLHQELLWLVWKNAQSLLADNYENKKIKFGEKMIGFNECDIDWGNEYFKKLIYSFAKEIISSLVGIKIMHINEMDFKEDFN